MAAAVQPASATAAILAPSSNADEGLVRQHRRSSTLSLTSDGKEENSNSASEFMGIFDDLALSTSLTCNELAPAPSMKPPVRERASVVDKELAPLVAMPPPSKASVQNRLAKHGYSRLGRNLLFEARPAVVHFGGYVLGKPHSQVVHVVNISRTSQRMHILGPATDSFKIRCNKKGLVAPGSSEAITVDFHPREHRYHYDCLRLHTDSDNLLVPLHAYPVMNDVIFPERLDFGVHALGETVRRTIKMVCKVPIQFEFEITVTKPHSHFKVTPLRGIVPANGAAEVYVEHKPSTASSGEMHLLVGVSQFNFTPIICVVTGAGKPGIAREAALNAAALELAGDDILRDSLGPAVSSYNQAQDRKLRGKQARNREKQREQQQRQHRRLQQRQRHRKHHQEEGGGDASAESRGGDGGGTEGSGDCGGEEGLGRVGRGLQTERAGSVRERLRREADSDGIDWNDATLELDRKEGEEVVKVNVARGGADQVDTWATRPPSAERSPYRTGKGSGAVFDVGGRWLAETRRTSGRAVEPWAPPTEGSAFGSTLGGPSKTSVVEGLVIPDRLDTVQAINFVLTQQPGKLKPKDLKEAIRRSRAERQRQLQEQKALRCLAATTTASSDGENNDGGVTNDGHGWAVGGSGQQLKQQQQEQQQQPAQLSGRAICAYEASTMGGSGGRGGGGGATRQLKEMSFLQDLADTEAEERDRSFKASVDHVGEPLLTGLEIERALDERRRVQRSLQRRRREAERGALETSLKGPAEVGARRARASLLLTGDGTQGVGFPHKPDWDVYKNDDWGRRREMLRRLVNAVGAWITRRRAARRLAAIQARLGGLRDREEVAAMVERDNLEAKLTAGPPSGALTVSLIKPSAGAQASIDNDDDSSSGGSWEFPELLVTSEALAAEMLAESMAAVYSTSASSSVWLGGRHEASPEGAAPSASAAARQSYSRSSSMPVPPPPEFRFCAGDVDRHRFPIYDEGAALSRREEVVDVAGPPSDFLEIDLLPLREPEEARSMGYASVRPPGLGTYPSIETSRPLRWSAFEECGVRQPRDEESDADAPLPPAVGSGWRQALSSTERRASKATLGRRRSSVGLRMDPATVECAEDAWLPAAEAELTALAVEAEKTERLPDALLFRPPPAGGVDLITPDPRYKPFLAELPADEASPEWCLRPQDIPREIPLTKGLLLGYAPGTTTLRAYAGAPRLSDSWKPKRERRSSGLACMRGQASRGVWQPARAPPPAAAAISAAVVNRRPNEEIGSGVEPAGGDGYGGGVVSGVARGTRPRGAGGGLLDTRVQKSKGWRSFELAADNVAIAAAAGDALSDSESEDDEEDAPVPTVADARTVFDVTTEEHEGSQDDAVGEDSGGMKDVFARESAMAALEAARRTKRIKDAECLPDRMSAISAEVQNIKHAFVLQTPFHRIRSCQAKATPKTAHAGSSFHTAGKGSCAPERPR